MHSEDPPRLQEKRLAGNSPDTTKQDEFSHIVRALLERCGRYQIVLIILISLNSMIIGINHTITTFHVYVPKFYCRDNPEEMCFENENGTNCPSGYSFDTEDDNTVAVEFETVCNKAMLAPLINSLYFVGVTVGSLICSSLCDLYGRRKLVLICLYAQILTGLALYYSNSYLSFVIFRLLQGFFVQGLQTCSYTLSMEFCPSRYRTIAASYWESNWAVGLGILGVVAYFIRDWRLLTLAMTLPAVIGATYSWLMPESIVWLEVQGRHKEALFLIKKISTINGRHDILEQCNQLSMDERFLNSRADNKSKSDELIGENQTKQRGKMSSILKNRVLRKHVFSMISIWFSVTLSYYGILFYLPNLAGQRHLNFEIGALIELIAYILAYFILSGLGRRFPMTFYQTCNGVLILTIAIFTMLPDESYDKIWIVVIALMAKGLAVSCFCGMFIYCSELLPTEVRGIGLGLCGSSARIGSLLAPPFMSLVRFVPASIPLGTMAILLLATATVTYFLPETLNTILPNTIAEADIMWGNPVA